MEDDTTEDIVDEGNGSGSDEGIYNWTISMQLNQKLSIISILLSHHLTWHCSSINKDLHRCDHKTVFVIVARLKLFRNDNKNNFVSKCCKFLANLCKSAEILNNFTTETRTKTILWAHAANFLQICANLQQYWNIAKSNDGSSIELINQSHGD